MINEVIVEIKDILLGKIPRKSVVEAIIAEPTENETYPAMKVQEDPMVWYRGMVLHLIHLLYHGRMEAVDALRQAHQIPKADFTRFAELTVDFLYLQGRYDECLALTDYCPMDTGRVTKVFLHHFRERLDKKDFGEAGKLWGKFQKKGVPKDAIHEEVKRAFKQAADFRNSPARRNYQALFELVALFDIPKAITHWVGMEQYKYCTEMRDYYTAALVAKNLNLHNKLSNRAGYEAYKHAMNRFRDNVSMGRYKTASDLPASDPLNIAKHVISQFHLLDYGSKQGNYDAHLIKNINELAREVFTHMVGVGVVAGNAQAAMHSMAVGILKDFDLLNERVNLTVALAIRDSVEKLIDDIEAAADGNVDVEKYFHLLRTLRMMYTQDYVRFDPAAIRLIKRALETKQVELAGEINRDFSCPMGDTTGMVLERIYEWTGQDDYESVITAIKYFPVQHLLKSNQGFMKTLRQYYIETIGAQKYLKAITIAEAFQLDRRYVLNAIRVNVLREIGNGNLEETRNIIKKYRVHRQEYLPLVQEAYLALLESNRQTAIKLRSEFGLGIFDIGLFNWLLHEVMGIHAGRSIERKLAEEVEKIGKEVSGD